MRSKRLQLLAVVLLAAARPFAAEEEPPSLSDERLVLQTALGDIELAFFPEVAPVTVAHIIELGRLGCVRRAARSCRAYTPQGVYGEPLLPRGQGLCGAGG
jgi:hypothetical protein